MNDLSPLRVAAPDLFANGGETGMLMRVHRWTGTPLGEPAHWPAALRTLVGVMMGSRQPMFLAWGAARTLLYNDGYALLLAHRHPTALGSDMKEVWSDIWADVGPIVEQAFAGEGTSMDDLELHMERFGEIQETHFAFSYTPVRDDTGRVAGMFCACTEITAQVLAARRLRESEEQSRALIDGARDYAIFTTDPFGTITTWSPGAEGIFGWSHDEAIGQNAALIFTPEDRAAGGPESELGAAAREGCANDERWHLRKDGSRVFMNGSARPLLNDDGSLRGFIKIARDETEQRQRTEALAESERQFREMADAAPVILWITDPDGVCTYLNKPWYAFTGQTRAEAEGFGWLDATHPDDKARASDLFMGCNARREPFYVEYRLRRTDGGYSWAIDLATPRFGANGEYLGYVGSVIDISERKDAEEALAEGEARFRALADNMSQLAWMTDEAGSIHWYNQRWYDYTGTTFEEMQGWGWKAVHHPEHVDRVVERFSHAIEAGEVWEDTFPLRGADGVYRWFLSRARPLHDEAGRLTGWFGTNTDVTALRAAEAALAESEARFRAIADSIETMIWSTRPDGFHDYYNRRWYEYTGIPEGSTDGDEWNGMFHPDDQPRAWERWGRSLETGEPYEIEYRLRHRSGQYRWVLGRAQAVRDGEGRITRWFGTCTDIQDIVEAREVLARSREELERRAEELAAEQDRLWEVSEDLLAVADYAGGMARVSPSWSRLLGYDEVKLLTEPYADLLHPDDLGRTVDALMGMQASNRPVQFENRVLAKDGGWRWLAWRVSPVANSERFYAVGRDVTAEKAATAELKRVEDQLRQAQKMEAVGQLTGGVAHDFNNLLQIVVGNLELLQRNLPADAARQRRSVDNAMSGAKRAVTLTQRLLAFSRRQPLEPKPVAVNKLVSGMSELLARALGETIALETVLAGGLWRVEVDPNQLENAILNLAVNARDAMPDGGKLTIETANTRLDESYVQQNVEVTPGQYAVICVSDTGQGMPKDVAARVFEPFFTTKEVGKGTGLGLSQVYGFVKQSGGHVKIYSEQGDSDSRGTTVKIYLPRYRGAGEEDEVPAEVEAPEGGPEETILVVEDDPDVRTYTVEVLRELGYEVIHAGDGPSALKLLRDAAVRCDLLFTDVVLPGGMNGEELAQEAHVARPGLKVLFTTGYARNAIVHQGRLDPGVRLITKPFTYADLAARVRDVLDEAAPATGSA